MKNQTLLIASLCLSTGLFVTPAAYAQQGKVKANVPFQFNAAGKVFPAGEYMFSTRQKQVVLRSADGRIGAYVLSNPVSEPTTDSSGRVVFHCYVRNCFLWQVWIPNQEAGRELYRTRLERKMAKKEAGTNFVVLGENGRTKSGT